jgi:peptide/nickel transport system permease protein
MELVPIHKRVIGLDVHQAQITACAILEEADGETRIEQRQFGAFKKDRRALAAWAAALDPDEVVMESTGIYWKSPYAALEAMGIRATVVNARHVKQVPGRKTDVGELIWSRLPATLLLMLGAIVAELMIGLPAGIWAASRRGTRADKTAMTLSFVGVSAPQFVVGLSLLYIFAYNLGWLPLGGYGTFAHLILPSLTLGLAGGGWYSRMMRSSMVDVLRQDYIRTARAKGVPEGRVILKHALKNAILPIVAMVGLDVGIFMSGAVVVESVFGWPGIGQLMWQAIQTLDIPIIMGVTVTAAAFIILGNLIADLVTPLVDPRIRLR